jgi:hypothetical protein
MFHPEQRYEIARLRYEEFAAQAQRDYLAARCCESRQGRRMRHMNGLGAWLRAAFTRSLHTVQRPFGAAQKLSAHEQ